MWGKLLELVARPSERVGELAVGAGLLVAAIGLLWTALAIGIGFLLWGLAAGLGTVLPRTAALALTGAIAVLAAGLGLWRLGRGRQAPPQPGLAELGVDLVAAHPLEAVLTAAAAGLVASSTGGPALIERLLAEWARMAPGAEPPR